MAAMPKLVHARVRRELCVCGCLGRYHDRAYEEEGSTRGNNRVPCMDELLPRNAIALFKENPKFSSVKCLQVVPDGTCI